MSITEPRVAINSLSSRDAAFRYARLGLAVFPVWSASGGVCCCPQADKCNDPGKHPRSRHGLRDATSDVGELERRRWKWESANVGIRTGAESGIVVIDVDNEPAWRRLKAQYGPPPTCPFVNTPRPGWHLWYRYPHRVVPSGTLVTGVDVKADGGYVVAPPSLHVSGRRYLWDETSVDNLPELPASWLAALTSANGTQRTQEDSRGHKRSPVWKEPVSGALGACGELEDRIQDAIAESMPTEVGQRHRCIFELARRFRSFLEYRDKPPEDLLDIFAEWYDKAVAVIGTKDWLKNWEDFVDAWKLVKYPTGTGSLQVFMDRAAETALPNYAAPFRIADTPVSMLLRVCRELQRDAGNRPFFLSARSAASICGVETMSGWRYLKCLVGFGVLAPVSTGEYATRKASEWRYIRPLDE